MTILICGGREMNDRQLVNETFDKLREYGFTPEAIISGMSRGADTVCVHWAQDNNVKVHEYPAQWTKFGKSAGYRRNEQMLDALLELSGNHIPMLLAFPGGPGTRHMKEIAKAKGVFVMEVVGYGRINVNGIPYIR